MGVDVVDVEHTGGWRRRRHGSMIVLREGCTRQFMSTGEVYSGGS
jgi:hypothetical protein